VELGSMDLKKSLIQYPQTALPGQLGNAVVFGHSVLPQFFNPKSYLTIFSTLFRLKIGDEISINFDGVEYKYKVEEMYEVQPTDLSVLEQRYDGKYLTLITCTPPGTYLRRLVVKSRIVENTSLVK
jgi:sortase A